MAEGTHWEWRGFGTVTKTAQDAFDQLPLKYPVKPWDNTKDEYLWIPTSTINVKLRTGGIEEGLKLKRFVTREKDIELWLEDPKELFPFAKLNAATLSRLAGILGLTFGAIPAPPFTARQTLDLFRQATPAPSVVTVSKKRQTRTSSKTVQIEIAQITSVDVNGKALDVGPELTSVSLESSVDLTNASAEEKARAFAEVDAAVTSAKLRESGFVEKNYLRAIEEWTAAARV